MTSHMDIFNRYNINEMKGPLYSYGCKIVMVNH